MSRRGGDPQEMNRAAGGGDVATGIGAVILQCTLISLDLRTMNRTKDQLLKRYQAEIQSVVGQIIKKYRPEKIILFGSLARGEYHEGSDIDLFIVKSNPPELGVNRIRELDRLIKYRIGVDFIVYKPEEVEERISLEDPFVKAILKEGKVLYG